MNIVFDLDGTLADTTHRQHILAEGGPSKWDRFFAACDGDAPNSPVIEVAKALYRDGDSIEIWSGRSESVQEMTLDWLWREAGVRVARTVPKKFDWERREKWGTPEWLVGRLLMRPVGDYRPDDELKRELLIRSREQGFSPDLVFDDRKRVVDMWRSEGVPCFQVAEGSF